MSNEEAIRIIEFVLGRGEEADRFGLRNEGITVYHNISKEREAFDLAIKALEERPKGKWIEVDVRNCHATLKCSVCDRVIEPSFTFGEYSYEDIKTFYPYCHCGADMRSAQNLSYADNDTAQGGLASAT